MFLASLLQKSLGTSSDSSDSEPEKPGPGLAAEPSAAEVVVVFDPQVPPTVPQPTLVEAACDPKPDASDYHSDSDAPARTWHVPPPEFQEVELEPAYLPVNAMRTPQ